MRPYTINDSDAELIRKFIEIRNRGHYASSTQLQDVFNRVFGVNQKPTNCGSCLRGRIQELENALRDKESKEAENKQAEDKPKTAVKRAAKAKTERKEG